MERGYEKVPATLIESPHVSLSAKGLYAILMRLAYKNGRKNDGDAVPMPPVNEIAKTCGCSVSALSGYIAELKATGYLKTKRGSKWSPALYAVLWDPSSKHEIHALTDASKRGIHVTRARDRLNELKDTSASHLSPPDVPAIVLVEVEGFERKQNLPLNALAEVCGVARSSPRFTGETTTALNGPTRHKERGIRAQFWEEVREQVFESFGGVDPEDFERALANAIGVRAAVYRKVMGDDVLLTPGALAKWWSDLPGLASAGTDVTSRMRRQAERLREEGK